MRDSSHMKERQDLLIEYVVNHGRTSVDDLAEYLGVSKVTIRKDLDSLSEQGLLRRERGYAIPNQRRDIHYQMAFQLQQKERIAREAVRYVQDGETLIIEAGSTCALFAKALAENRKDVTIITNSLYLASYIQDYNSVHIILLGGALQPESRALVGPLTKQSVSAFHVDKIFLGTDGFSEELGFTGNDMIRSETLEYMLKSADHVYVLTDSMKFRQPGAVSFLKTEDATCVITDAGISDATKSYLEARGITVISV